MVLIDRMIPMLVLCTASLVARASTQLLDEFDAESPMEIRASAEQVDELLARYPDRSYLVFPEDRRWPIRMADALPVRWVERGPGSAFAGQAQPGEFYTFQIGVFAARKPIRDIAVDYADLKAPNGKVIPASALRCFNLGGVDWQGRRFCKQVAVPKAAVQTLWFGLAVPADAAGRYEGSLTIRTEIEGVTTPQPTQVQLSLEVSGESLADHGDNDLWRHSRLRWLDSTIALDDEVTAPYTPLEVADRTVRCLGRQLTFADTGLPESIVSYFADTADRIQPSGREILAGPITLAIETDEGRTDWAGTGSYVVTQKPASVTWQSDGAAGLFAMNCRAQMEYDGYVSYRLRLEVMETIDVNDIRLEIPFRRDVAKLLMGMNRRGGCRPKNHEWKWDKSKHQDCVWIGDVDAGLKCQLIGPNYVRPFVNIYYRYQPLNLPPDWHNNGKGGCRVMEQGDDRVVVQAYTGPRALRAGEQLNLWFNLLITPVKTIDPVAHWKHRYYHRPPGGGAKAVAGWIEDASQNGANIINVHHGSILNPFINYPFVNEFANELATFVKTAHESQLKVKLYYTVRELSNHVVELWALRSLGDEVLAIGKGAKEQTILNRSGGDPWLKKHLRTNYIPAWRHVFKSERLKGYTDAALVTSGMSRWHNYYLEGLKWLVDNTKIDGLYLDGIAYDRTVMQRVRKILDRYRPGSLIDVHDWDSFQGLAAWVSPANLYMEHLPYIDRLWFGESFQYDKMPADYWLVEISGIPFGLMGEMLQHGGNPWRGMVYGMTNRLRWGGNPTHLWKFWDAFGIQQAQMIGYWSSACPVKTNHKDVLATVYRRKDKALVALASWAPELVQCRLKVDWGALGLDPQKARFRIPAIPDFQDEAVFELPDEIPVPPAKGYLLVIEPQVARPET